MAVTQAQVAQLYVALFNRAPEGSGLKAWTDASSSRTQAQTADAMLTAPAVKEYFNGRIDSDKDFIENIYKNVLGKDYSQDKAGIDSWVKHLQLGHTRGETLVKLFEVAQSPEAIAAAPINAAIFKNKIAISEYMASKVGEIEQDGSGNYDYAPFQEIIASTDNTNLDAQKAKIDKMVREKVVKKALTTDIDDIKGNDGDDTFSAIYYAGNGTKTSTLSSFDKVDGGNGNDTFNLTVFKNTGFNPTTDLNVNDLNNALKGVQNIENLNIESEAQFLGTATIPFNKGLDNFKISTVGKVDIATDTKEKIAIDTNGAVKLKATVVKEVSIKGGANSEIVDAGKATKVSVDLTNNSNTLTITAPLADATDVKFANLKLTTADVVVAKAKTINVSDVDFGTFKISTDEKDVDFTMAYKEKGTATLTSTAAVDSLALHAKAGKSATFKLDTITSLTKATIDGDAKDLTVDLSTQTGLKTIDASKFIGNFAELKVKNVADSNVVSGSGDDVIELDGVANKQTIDAGAGTDLIGVTSTVATAATNNLVLKNFEGLKITNALGANLDMSKWADFNNVTLGDGISAAHSISNILNNSTITLENTALAHDLTLDVKDAANGKADTLNLVFDPKGETAGLVNSGNVVVDNVEVLNVTSKADKDNTSGAKNVIKLNATHDVYDTSHNLTAHSKGTLEKITVTGDGDTVLELPSVVLPTNANPSIKPSSAISKLKSVDASALKGKFVFNSTDHVDDKAVVKGGTADDTITFASTMATTVTGGAGKDTFVINKGINPVTFAASKTSTITDFTKGDTIKIGGSAAAVAQDKIVKYEVSGSLDFANNFKEALKAAGEQKVAYFTYRDPDSNSTDTYIVKSNEANAVADGDDYVVKLSGAVDLSNATITTSGNDTLITL